MGKYGQGPVAEVIYIAFVVGCTSKLSCSVTVISNLVFTHWCVLAEEEGLFTYVAAFGVFVYAFLLLAHSNFHVLLHLLQAVAPSADEFQNEFLHAVLPDVFP